MSKIKVEDIRKAAIDNGWQLVSTEYKNLSTELTFICNEGHEINIPYKKVRDKWECPLCKANKYYNFSEEVKPKVDEIVNDDIKISKSDWDSFETSWDFKKHPLI